MIEISIPPGTDIDVNMPRIRFQEATLRLAYDADESGEGREWSRIQFDGVLDFRFGDYAGDNAVFITSSNLMVEWSLDELNSPVATCLQESERRLSEFRKAKGIPALRCWSIWFDDSGVLEVFARAYSIIDGLHRLPFGDDWS